MNFFFDMFKKSFTVWKNYFSIKSYFTLSSNFIFPSVVEKSITVFACCFFLQLLPYMDTILRYFHYMFEGKVITLLKKVMFHLAEIIFFLFKTMTESLQIKRHVIDFCFLEVSQVINLTSFRVQIFKQ